MGKWRNKSAALTAAKARFWDRIEPVTESGCWIWKGSITGRGYGHLFWDGHSIASHRFSWVIAHGTIPDGMQVCHRCDVRACVRPDHLFLGNASENMQDAARKGRMHHPQKLTDEDAEKIVREINRGVTQVLLARRFGVTQQTISSIKRGRIWKGIAVAAACAFASACTTLRYRDYCPAPPPALIRQPQPYRALSRSLTTKSPHSSTMPRVPRTPSSLWN